MKKRTAQSIKLFTKKCGYTFLISTLFVSISACKTVPQLTEKPIHEPIEWTDIWVTSADKDDLPRVLFVGDSITRGYFKAAEKNLKGKAYCARLATSAFIGHEDFLSNLSVLLKRYRWDVIHINNGLHGWDYTEEQYRDGFPALIKLLNNQAEEAQIIWALTTPMRERDKLEQLNQKATERVRERNKIAIKVVREQRWTMDDLFSLVIDHADYYRSGGTHFNSKGIAAQGKQVADVVEKLLPSSSSSKSTKTP
jgi:lysophospholipase L1-like esterase